VKAAVTKMDAAVDQLVWAISLYHTGLNGPFADVQSGRACLLILACGICCFGLAGVLPGACHDPLLSEMDFTLQKVSMRLPKALPARELL
jgi:hypothetical protein